MFEENIQRLYTDNFRTRRCGEGGNTSLGPFSLFSIFIKMENSVEMR